MEKQQKVLKNIHKDVAATTLGKKNNDECYTSMQDILNELSYWAALGKFTGKKIVCPCDWDVTDDKDIYGIKINYKEDPAEISAFKSVKSVKITKVVEYPGTLFETSSEIKEESVETKLVEYELREDEIEDFLRDKLTCNFVRMLTQNARRWGIKSITASGYNPATDRGIKFQDVDYSKYDVCITNPPFSLYGEFMKCIVGNIDFIVLAPFLNRVNPNVGLPLMLRQAYLGYNYGIHITFDNPTIENKFNTKIVLCDWITSFNEAQIERNKKCNTSGIKYDLYKDEYKTVIGMTMKDGTHPIKVPGCQIPEDYDGWMFSDISVIDRLSYDEYEWYGTSFKGFYNKINTSLNPFTHACTDDMLKAEGKKLFHSVVFRKKKKVD